MPWSSSAPHPHPSCVLGGGREWVACPLPQATVVRCSVSSCLDDQGTTTALKLHSGCHHCGGNPLQMGKQEGNYGTCRAEEQYPSLWQGSTGLSSFPKYARHRENPQAQSVSTASSPEHSREEKPQCEDVVTVLHKN